MEPYKIYDFEDEKAWLKGRLNGIGGSDASAVVGKNPYKTTLSCLKKRPAEGLHQTFQKSLM